jgi:Spy/CpxP family protein refolding chaperone
MKAWKFSAMLFGAIMAVGTMMAAQEGATPQMGQGMGQGQMSQGQARGRLQWMAQQLNLTDDQKEKLKPILMKEGMDMKQIRDNTSLSPDDKRTQMKAVHDKYRPDIRGILTPEQQQKFDQMKEEGMEHHKGMQGGDMAKPQ